jgi:stage IV sporulation protein B
MLQCLTATVLICLYGVPASAARLLIPVGEVVGLSLSEGSVTVAAFHETCGAAAREAGIEIGDEIVAIDGKTVDGASDLYEALRCSDGAVTVELRRGGRSRQVRISPAVTDQGPRLGVYVREGVTGIGTVTYYDPDRGTFGALGHGISDSRGELAPMRSGWVYEAAVESVKKGRAGEPGQLRGAVQAQTPMRSLRSNTTFGVFGSGTKWTGEALPIARPGEVREGKAQILSNVSGDEVAFFDVEIVKCGGRSSGRDLLIHVTDQELLEATGGIVAGMSGSPIIQDGKLVGAVTHVLVNDPTRGYGIFIENMLDAAG